MLPPVRYHRVLGVSRLSALMRAPHHLHGVFEMTPFLGFLGIALAFAGLGIAGRLRDRLKAVLFKHLPRDGVDLHLGDHVALPVFAEFGAAGTGSSTMLRLLHDSAEPEFWFH